MKKALCFIVSLILCISVMPVAAFADNDYETLFHCADQALYAAKRGGRGRYCFYRDDLPDTIHNKAKSSLSKIESNDPNREC